MKENKYDNENFFIIKYSQMERSKKGYGAGEWHKN